MKVIEPARSALILLLLRKGLDPSILTSDIRKYTDSEMVSVHNDRLSPYFVWEVSVLYDKMGHPLWLEEWEQLVQYYAKLK